MPREGPDRPLPGEGRESGPSLAPSPALLSQHRRSQGLPSVSCKGQVQDI